MLETSDKAGTRATVPPKINPGAEAPPPLSLVERVRIACENKRGEYGGDLVLLAARLDAFLGRPATPTEIDAYADAAGAICSDRDDLEGFFGGVDILLTNGTYHEFVPVNSAAAERYRTELLESGTGYVEFGRSNKKNAVLQSFLFESERGEVVQVVPSKRNDAPFTLAYFAKGEVDGRADEAEGCGDLQDLIASAFFLGRRTAEETDSEPAAISHLRPGEVWTRMLLDLRPFSDDECPLGSYRLSVERAFEGGFSLFTEVYARRGDGVDRWYNSDGGEGWPTSIAVTTAAEVVELLPFYRKLGESQTKDYAEDWAKHKATVAA